MTLYEIDNRLEELLEEIIDPETGEITDTSELDALNLEREIKVENTACYIKNLRALESGIDAEIKALQARKKRIANRHRKLSDYLQEHLCGQRFESARCCITFRKSHPVEVADEAAAISWLENEGHGDCLRCKAPEISKSNLKMLLELGVEVPGCRLVTRQNMQIK